MSIAQLLSILRASRWSILLMALACIGTAYLFADSLPKQYTAKARVMLELANSDPAQYSSFKRDSAAGYIGTQLRLVGDIGVTRAVVAKLGWADNPQVIAAWQQATGGVGEVDRWAASRLAASLGANQLEDSAIIEILYSAGEPQAAKQIVGVVRTAYIENARTLRAQAAQRAAAWNRDQAARALAALQRAEQVRLDFARANNIVLDRRGESPAMTELDYLRDAGARRAGAAKAFQPSPAMLGLQRQLNDIDAQLAIIQIRGGTSNPDYVLTTARRNILVAQLGRETAIARARSGNEEVVTAATRARLNADYLRARLEVLDQAPTYDRLAQLEREVALRRSFYQAAAARVENLDMIAAAPAGVEVLGDVIGSDSPSFPNIPLITGLAAVFGLGLGVSLALFGEMSARRVRGAEDLEFSSRVPVLAVIGARRPSTGPWLRSRWPFARAGRRAMLQPAE